MKTTVSKIDRESVLQIYRFVIYLNQLTERRFPVADMHFYVVSPNLNISECLLRPPACLHFK